jgi:putative flippase GtrA
MSISRLPRQFAGFVIAGVAAAAVHYGMLIALVETGAARPVPATLAGFAGGGLVSYALNRRLAFESRRRHREAAWRFALVAAVGLGLTGLVMSVVNGLLGVPYLAAQVLTTGVVLVWSFLAHRLWTFGDTPVVP